MTRVQISDEARARIGAVVGAGGAAVDDPPGSGRESSRGVARDPTVAAAAAAGAGSVTVAVVVGGA